MTIGLDRSAAIVEVFEFAYRAEPTAPLASAARVLTQLVAADPERQMRFDILDRIVAGGGVERIDRVHAVEPTAPAIAALENLHMHPVASAISPGAHAGEGDNLEIADTGRDLARHRLSQRLHHRVGDRVAGTEAGDGRCREDRVSEGAQRRADFYRA